MKKRRVRVFLNEAGQGILEYLLILIITVMIILGLLAQFNSSFAAYAEAFFDGYIACLLEVGELPGVGGYCMSEFPPFDYKPGPLSGSAGGGSDSNDPNSEQPEKPSDTGPRSEATSSGSGGGRSASSRVGSFGNRGRQASTPVGGGEGAGSEEEGGVGDLIGGGGRPSSSFYDRAAAEEGRQAVTNEFSMSSEERQSEEKSRPQKTTAATANEKALSGRRAVEREPAQIKKIQEDNLQEGFSFGNLIRLLLIAAIVVIIFVLIGGQLLQFSKSREKGGD